MTPESKPLALLVEDNPDDRRLLAYYLDNLGYRTLLAENGAAALEVAKGNPPDLIVSDALMPDMDGFQFLRQVRSDASLNQIPFVFYSAVYTGSHDRELALSLGADAFIVKPKDPEQFKDELQAILERCRDSGEPQGKNLPDETTFLRRYGETVARKVGEKVGELNRARQELADNQRLYSYLFNSIRDVIVITDFDRRILDANQPALRETFGYELKEIVGQSTRLLYAEPQGFELAGRHFFERRGKGERWKALETAGRRKNGETFPVEILGIGIRDEKGRIIANLGIVRDITRRKQTETSLRQALDDAQQAHDRIDAILKSVSDGMLVTDNQSRIILMNRAAEEFFGFSLEQVRERPLGEVLKEKLLLQQHLRVVDGEAEEIVLDLEMTDRSMAEVRTIEARTAAVTGGDGRRSGTITILRDVTREREIARLKSEFISLAAHELRTPLSAVMGFSELLINNPDLSREQQLECAHHIFAKAEHLDLIVDDLLDLSRLESGRPLHLEKAPVDLRSTLRKVVRQYREEAANHHIALELPPQPLTAMADEEKIVQVLENLLSNAVKYSPGGGKVEVIAQNLEEFCRITVADEGIGMSADQVERVFDKFYRADTSNTAISGLGLGMNIAKMIIEDHGGQIDVESWPEVGTKVTFTLPLAST